MNLQILSATIVKCVQHSPDSAHNLAEMVAGLIREEMNRSAALAEEFNEREIIRFERQARDRKILNALDDGGELPDSQARENIFGAYLNPGKRHPK